YCRSQGLGEHQELTCEGAKRFATWWRSQGSPRPGRLRATLQSSRSAVRAWSFALGVLGVKVPPWKPPVIRPPLSAAMTVFAAYCQMRRRTVARARLQDIDDFVVVCRKRYARTTVSDICSTVRGFLRFLCATGRSRHDLSSSIIAPIIRVG